jgi:hypothetical protein
MRRQLRDGQAPVLLEHGKDFAIHGVHVVDSSSLSPHSNNIEEHFPANRG